MISKGTIYKIVCKLNDIVYVGSTFKTLSKRWYVHKQCYNQWLNDKCGKCSIYDSFKKYGIENFKIIEIKKYDVYREYYKDYKHLLSKEQLWINKLKCVNSNCAFNPIPEKELKKYYYENNKDKIKERNKEYYENNKDKIKEKNKEYNLKNIIIIKEKLKQYYENNKEIIKEKSKQYYENNKEKDKQYRLNNKEKIKEKAKQYRLNNKDKIKEYEKIKITCGCGSTYRKCAKARHERTNKHMNYINN